MATKCYVFSRRGVSPVIATMILLAIFTVIVAASLSVSQTLLSGGYTQSDSSEAASMCSALAASVNRVGFAYGEAESVGYTFQSSTIAFIPNALKYTINFSVGASISVSTGVLLVATPAKHYSFGRNYYVTLYPAGVGLPIAPSSGPNSSAVWSIQDEYAMGGAEYVFTLVYPLPELVNTGISVGQEAVWRVYVLRLIGGSGVEPFSRSGYVSVGGLGEQVYSYTGVNSVSVQAISLTQAYPTGLFRVNTTGVQLGSDDGGAIVQIVVGNVSVSGTTM